MQAAAGQGRRGPWGARLCSDTPKPVDTLLPSRRHTYPEKDNRPRAQGPSVHLVWETCHTSSTVPRGQPTPHGRGSVQTCNGTDSSRSLLASFGNGFLICFSPRLQKKKSCSGALTPPSEPALQGLGPWGPEGPGLAEHHPPGYKMPVRPRRRETRGATSGRRLTQSSCRGGSDGSGLPDCFHAGEAHGPAGPRHGPCPRALTGAAIPRPWTKASCA